MLASWVLSIHEHTFTRTRAACSGPGIQEGMTCMILRAATRCSMPKAAKAAATNAGPRAASLPELKDSCLRAVNQSDPEKYDSGKRWPQNDGGSHRAFILRKRDSA